MRTGNAISEAVSDLAVDYELIKSIGSIFLLEDTNVTELCETLETMEELPENCLFSDDLLTQMRDNHYYWVRRICAMNGRPSDLDILVADPNDLVRFEVLFHKRPQDLKILKEDTNPDIREAAIGFLNSNCGHNGILGRY